MFGLFALFYPSDQVEFTGESEVEGSEAPNRQLKFSQIFTGSEPPPPPTAAFDIEDEAAAAAAAMAHEKSRTTVWTAELERTQAAPAAASAAALAANGDTSTAGNNCAPPATPGFKNLGFKHLHKKAKASRFCGLTPRPTCTDSSEAAPQTASASTVGRLQLCRGKWQNIDTKVGWHGEFTATHWYP